MRRFVASIAVVALSASACSVAPQSTQQTAFGSALPTTGVPATSSPNPPAPTSTLVPVVAMPGSADIGPQGAIVFYRTDDTREVDTQFIVNPDGTNERELQPALGAAVWSPDGRLVAFSWGDWNSGKTRAAVMQADGSSFRVLDPNPDLAIRFAPAAWSANGKQLLLMTAGKDVTPVKDVGAWSVGVAGGDLHHLLGASEGAEVGEMFIPSPDGTKALHNRITMRKDIYDLNILSIESIDGRHDDRISSADPDLSVVDLEFYDGTSEAWSPDSTQIVFCMVNVLNGASAMYTARSDGGGVEQLVPTSVGAVSARFSPDARQIAFTAERGPDDQIWVMDRDGTHRRQLTFGDDHSVSLLPLWSRDGRSLVFQRRMHAHGQITLWRVDVDGTNLIQLSPTPLAKEWVGGYAWWPAPG